MILQQGEHDDIVTDDSRRTVGWLGSTLNSDQVYIEIGAHIGHIATPVIQRAKPKLSLLVEPHPASCVYLKLNLEKYAVGTKWHIIQKMAMDKVGRADYWYFENSPPHGSLYKRTQDALRWEMETVTVDSLIEEYGLQNETIRMKIDAEMAEPFIWKGMKKYMNNIFFIIMEFMPHHLRADMHINPEEFINEIKADGFKVIRGLKGNELTEREIFSPSGSKVDLILTKE